MRFALIFPLGLVSLCHPLCSIFSQICGHSSSLIWNVNSGSIFLSFIRSNSRSWKAVLNLFSSKEMFSIGSFLFCLLELDDAISDFWDVKVLRIMDFVRVRWGVVTGVDESWVPRVGGVKNGFGIWRGVWNKNHLYREVVSEWKVWIDGVDWWLRFCFKWWCGSLRCKILLIFLIS